MGNLLPSISQRQLQEIKGVKLSINTAFIWQSLPLNLWYLINWTNQTMCSHPTTFCHVLSRRTRNPLASAGDENKLSHYHKCYQGQKQTNNWGRLLETMIHCSFLDFCPLAPPECTESSWPMTGSVIFTSAVTQWLKERESRINNRDVITVLQGYKPPELYRPRLGPNSKHQQQTELQTQLNWMKPETTTNITELWAAIPLDITAFW